MPGSLGRSAPLSASALLSAPLRTAVRRCSAFCLKKKEEEERGGEAEHRARPLKVLQGQGRVVHILDVCTTGGRGRSTIEGQIERLH